VPRIHGRISTQERESAPALRFETREGNGMPPLLNLIRLLFVHGRDQYERVTLPAKEYQKRQDQRSRNGCIGCLVFLMIPVALLIAIRQDQPEPVAAYPPKQEVPPPIIASPAPIMPSPAPTRTVPALLVGCHDTTSSVTASSGRACEFKTVESETLIFHAPEGFAEHYGSIYSLTGSVSDGAVENAHFLTAPVRQQPQGSCLPYYPTFVGWQVSSIYLSWTTELSERHRGRPG
jgi:hypothetical protein